MQRLRLILLSISMLTGFSISVAQYDPAGGVDGSFAVHRDDVAISQWATSAQIQLGFQNVADTTLGYANVGTNDDVKGKADGYCVSLGDGGMATLYFDPPIKNIESFDFAVFENGFEWGNSYFLELAFVEVSSDGKYFARFPALSDADTTVQIENLAYMQSVWYSNLAGKHQAPYGTPFDLELLKDDDSIDIQSIKFVRLIDVVGSLNDTFASRDSRGVKINDPWPTGFAPSGFDLDAVGVITGILSNTDLSQNQFRLTNPISAGAYLPQDVLWFSMEGKLLNVQPNHVPEIPGIYIVKQMEQNQLVQLKICVTP